jgi:hypothetical protein
MMIKSPHRFFLEENKMNRAGIDAKIAALKVEGN